MLFYMCNVPSAVIDINVIERIVMQRYASYSNTVLLRSDRISCDDDALGHFVMCLIANRCVDLKDTILQGEQNLFLEKLKNLSRTELNDEISCAVNIFYQMQKIQISPSLDNRDKQCTLKNALTTLRQNSNHICKSNHRENCQKFHFVLPFTCMLNAVSMRKVEVIKGKCAIPCGQWKMLIQSVFCFILEYEIMYMKNLTQLKHAIYEVEDNRLQNVIKHCIDRIIGKSSAVKLKISADMVDNELKYFPPCMANLHYILRKTHRLSYDSRYQYTLFLKDIGLPVNENVSFWKNEYSKPYNSSTCTHDWGNKFSRYEYQIHHAYGLKGSCATKTSHCCNKFTGRLSLKMNSGCPFAHMNKDDLINLLHRLLDTDADGLTLKLMNDPQRDCAQYFEYIRRKRPKVTDTDRKLLEILSPLHYYNSAKNDLMFK